MTRRTTPIDALLLVLLAPVLSQSISVAQENAPPPERRPDPFEIEAAYTYESLTNSVTDWRSAYLEVLKKFDARTALYGGFRQTQRFSLNDQELLAGVYYPLSADLGLFSELSGSPSHRVLPEWSGAAELQKGFTGGWVVHAAFRHISFQTSAANLAYLTAERYWDRFRASYIFYVSYLEGSASLAHRVTGSWYYEDYSALNLSLSIGDEAENIGPPRGVLTSRVVSFSIFGRHWLTDTWAGTYEFLVLQQANIYTRRGIRLGIRCRI